MITINYGGRLGNNMIQYSAARLFSNKHKIKLITPPINGDINFTSLLKSNDDTDHQSYQNTTQITYRSTPTLFQLLQTSKHNSNNLPNRTKHNIP